MTTFHQSGLFGDLFSDPAIAQVFDRDRFVARMIDFERAWTIALSEVGLATPQDAQQALEAMDRFRPDWADLQQKASRDGLPVPALVAQIKAAAAVPAVHAGATSQDVIDTAMVLTLIEVADLLDGRFATVTGAIAALRQRFGARGLMGRTRMQAALPITVADRLDAWQRGLDAAAASLVGMRPQLARLQYGGAVGIRDAVDGQGAAIAASVATTLGLSVAPQWHSDRSSIVGFGHALVLISGACGKIGQDIALMAQQGVDAVRLSGGGGSSAMPHKQNPIRAELLVTLARFVAGQQSVLASALIHEQERSGSAWGLEWMVLPQMAEISGCCMLQLMQLLEQITDLGDQ